MELSRIELFPGQLLVRLAGQPGPTAEPVEIIKSAANPKIQSILTYDCPTNVLHVLLRCNAVLTLVHQVDTPSLARYFVVDESDAIALVMPTTKKGKTK